MVPYSADQSGKPVKFSYEQQGEGGLGDNMTERFSEMLRGHPPPPHGCILDASIRPRCTMGVCRDPPGCYAKRVAERKPESKIKV